MKQSVHLGLFEGEANSDLGWRNESSQMVFGLNVAHLWICENWRMRMMMFVFEWMIFASGESELPNELYTMPVMIMIMK